MNVSLVMNHPDNSHPDFLPSSGWMSVKGWELMHVWFDEEMSSIDLEYREAEAAFLGITLHELDMYTSSHRMCRRNGRFPCILSVYSRKFDAIMRLQRFCRRCPYLIRRRNHRRELLLAACLISRQSGDAEASPAFHLGSLFNDGFGGIMREYVAPMVLGDW